MANSVQIKYNGEVLCCLDQTEVKAVEPYLSYKPKPQNLIKRMRGWAIRFLSGKSPSRDGSDYEEWTKISFKDGTWIRIKMPFWEFANAYC